MSELRCVIEHITYQNAENGYTIMKATAEGYPGSVTVVGYLGEEATGSVLRCEGEWKMDKRYGRQFAITSWERIMPATAYGLEKYLGSGLIKGIGAKYARLIVGKFGTGTIDIIESHPERLSEVPGIGEKRIAQIRQSWKKQKDITNIMIFLQNYGVSTTYAAKIYRMYGKESVQKVQSNPYRLADEVWGIGFKTADDIAEKMGYAKDDIRRCKSGLVYALNRFSDEGHVFAQKKSLIERAETLLNIAPDNLEEGLTQMVQAKEIIIDGEAVYLPHYFYAEQSTARLIVELIRTSERSLFAQAFSAEKFSDESEITYDEVQLSAIKQAMKSKVMVLTGGPGTGKTTTTRAIISAFRSAGLHVLLAAPTGRAAKRMSEATAMEAKTIHRLLEYNPTDGYKRNRDNPLEGDALIVDECAMIDLLLMNSLIEAVPTNMRLVFVGDTDQLPSVGAGNVLHDIIESGVVPVIRLTRIFRQAQTSRIVMNAHTINHGAFPDTRNEKDSDFFFMNADNPEQVVRTIVELVKERIPRAYHELSSNIQVLTPMQRGTVGAANLNRALQQELNTSSHSLTRGGMLFKKGDRVMQVHNNYDKNVFNGDLGYIDVLNQDEGTLVVNFDGRLVEYELSELEELTLAYATTIHKSQGSEYPIVIMPILASHFVMLQRNLIYTGITRARKLCILIGEKRALSYAIKNTDVLKRNTHLKECLQHYMRQTV